VQKSDSLGDAIKSPCELLEDHKQQQKWHCRPAFHLEIQFQTNKLRLKKDPNIGQVFWAPTAECKKLVKTQTNTKLAQSKVATWASDFSTTTPQIP
jgi:hypothetical protein